MSDLHKFNGECVGEPVDPGIVAEHVVEGAGTTWTMRLTEGEIYCLYDKVTPAGHPNRVVFQAVLPTDPDPQGSRTFASIRTYCSRSGSSKK